MPIVNISQSTVAPSTSADPLQIGTGASIRTGTSSPEGAETGSVGDIFLQTDGSANAVLFIKESGSATNTGWKAYASHSAVTGSTGTTSSSFQIDNDSSGCSIRTAAGSPESAVTGSVGDLFLRDDGSAGSCLYIKESGSASNTGWQAYASKAYHDGDDAQNIKIIAVPIADPAGTFQSTATIPANSRVLRVDKTISEVFNGTPTVTVGYTGSLSAFAGTADTDLTSATTQILSMNKASDSSARTVICTVGGTPSQGAGVIYVHFVESTIA